jgi:ABC-type xylose transport system permease subunit
MDARSASTGEVSTADSRSGGTATTPSGGRRQPTPVLASDRETVTGLRSLLALVRDMPSTRLQMAASVAALVLVALIFEAQTSLFLSSRNITELLLESIQVAVMALGLIFVLLLGEIDLSVAGLSAVCATITASAIVVHHMSTGVGIGLGLASGVAFELVQGAIITVFGAPSLIVTLGGSLVLSGLLLVLLPSSEQIPLGATTLGSFSSDYVATGLTWTLVIICGYSPTERAGRARTALRSRASRLAAWCSGPAVSPPRW